MWHRWEDGSLRTLQPHPEMKVSEVKTGAQNQSQEMFETCNIINIGLIRVQITTKSLKIGIYLFFTHVICW